ncbi:MULTISPECIES: redoxin domain-containing protein [unclassified Nocardioides]|uniref:redoxin domain-containing protein n=1 Tax=unclassified Nocardioides TaxID=2615069 RepID=UPI0000EB618D|nr:MULTISPECIES: redoxin domain-containing protein [unclassified Nocardioides]ABL81156.1 hypothetical protein Noca_1643 [Nocardioides sp. JS614]
MTAEATIAVPLDLALSTPEGAPIVLRSVLEHPLTVVHLVRYYGCLPCQDWLVRLDRAAGELAREGVGAIAIGGSADYQARWLREERGVRVSLLLDPEQRFRDHVGAADPLGWHLLDPRGAAAYTRSLARGFRPQHITRDTVRSPGVVVLDATGAVRWRHVGTRIGHYPSLDKVRAAVSRLR